MQKSQFSISRQLNENGESCTFALKQVLSIQRTTQTLSVIISQSHSLGEAHAFQVYIFRRRCSGINTFAMITKPYCLKNVGASSVSQQSKIQRVELFTLPFESLDIEISMTEYEKV